MDPRNRRRRPATGRQDSRLTDAEPLDPVRVHDVFVTKTATPLTRRAASETVAAGLLGGHPSGLRARHARDQLGRFGDVLAVGDEGVEISEDLVAQAVGGRLEVGTDAG